MMLLRSRHAVIGGLNREFYTGHVVSDSMSSDKVQKVETEVARSAVVLAFVWRREDVIQISAVLGRQAYTRKYVERHKCVGFRSACVPGRASPYRSTVVQSQCLGIPFGRRFFEVGTSTYCTVQYCTVVVPYRYVLTIRLVQ